jgi:hypothetical protein
LTSYMVSYTIFPMSIIMPDWLGALKPTQRDERNRVAAGLYPKRDGWYKSVDNKTRYVCKPCAVADAVKALDIKFPRSRRGGRKVVVGATLTLDQLIEMFLANALERVTTGMGKKMKRSTYDGYVTTLFKFSNVVGGNRFVAALGPDDFTAYMRSIAGKAPSTIRREVQYIDRLFNWAGPGKKSMNLIPFVVQGPDWVKPPDDAVPADAAESDKAYSVPQLRRAYTISKADPLLRAAFHLGFASAFAPIDVAMLPESFVDLAGAEIRFPREKTGFARACPMMPDAVDAMREWLVFRRKIRKVQPDAAHLMFYTRQGHCLHKWWAGEDDTAAGYKNNRLSRRWSQVVGLPFSGLRSAFASIADDWTDQRAIDVVMGHSVGKTGKHVRQKHYAKKFSIERARKLVEYVWLTVFPEVATSTPSPSPAAGGR